MRAVRTATGTVVVAALTAGIFFMVTGGRQPADATSPVASVLNPVSTLAPSTPDKSVMVTEAPTTSPTPPTTATITAPTTSTSTTQPPTGMRNLRTAQEKLTDIGYWLGASDGKLGTSTKQALLAFQKVNGLPRTSQLDDATVKALESASRPEPKATSGDLIEIDKSRQVIFVVRNGTAKWIFNTSTGTEKAYNDNGHRGVAHTPVGDFTVFRHVNASDRGPLGALYRPKYFTSNGVAVHGSASVPATPASHGCARVTNAVMDFVWSQELMPIGTKVVVY
jgi:peptidoglycan hydrolase-like protein with peptidoglycan-binding domain